MSMHLEKYLDRVMIFANRSQEDAPQIIKNISGLMNNRLAETMSIVFWVGFIAAIAAQIFLFRKEYNRIKQADAALAD